MSRNLEEEEAKWWESGGEEGNPPDNNEIVEGPSPRELSFVEPLSYSTNVTRAKKKRITSAPVAASASTGASKTKQKYIPPHMKKDVNLNSLNTDTSLNSKSTSNKYAKSKHRNAAIRLLSKNLSIYGEPKDDEYIKLKDSNFGINCNDVHIHVYNNKYRGPSAGIRFRFDDNTELQYNIGDGGGNDGFQLMQTTPTKYWGVDANGTLSLSQTINKLLYKLENVSLFENSKCRKEIISLNDKGQLGNFLQKVSNAVEVAANAPMTGGKRKTRKRKRKGKKKTHKKKKRKRKTKRNPLRKKKTLRKRKTRKRKTRKR
jgi:hypothetical protein